MKRTKTARGFRLYDFKDRNAIACSLQASSVATESLIWLGRDGDGTRMHLTRKMARELAAKLMVFAETGELP